MTLAAFSKRYLSQSATLIIVAALTGILAGTAAWVLKYTIGHLASLVLRHLETGGPNWYLAGVPVIGILLAVAYQHLVIHTDLEHGTDRIAKDLAAHRTRMPVARAWQPVIASIVTLGLGGSAGAEGPVASSGSAIGSNMARAFGMTPQMMGIMIGCGAGAGIAGIFKSPIGGVLFTLEVLRMPMTTISVLALIVAAVCGSMTCYAMTGFTFDITFLPDALFSPAKFGWIIGLGIFCGVYAVYYSKITHVLHRYFKSITNPWLRGLSGGVIVSVSLLLFPAMYGEGYGVVTDLINGHTDSFLYGSIGGTHDATGWYLAIAALAVMLIKVFATIATNSSGGVAGDFAPTIYAGAFCGIAYALIANRLLDADLPVGLFALYGTAGAFAGIIHAPLMAMFLVAEMVGNGFGYFLPLMATSVVSYLTMKLLTPGSRFRGHDDLDALARKTMTDDAEGDVHQDVGSSPGDGVDQQKGAE